MLMSYWQIRGGILFLEVPIGGSILKGAWKDDSRIRRIDGVLLRVKGRRAGAYRFSRKTADLFRASLPGVVELIEAKSTLNRGAIGQAIVARQMFHRQYGVLPNYTTVVCLKGDSALEWVCRQEKVRVRNLKT